VLREMAWIGVTAGLLDMYVCLHMYVHICYCTTNWATHQLINTACSAESSMAVCGATKIYPENINSSLT
jgi:hypothetical protein